MANKFFGILNYITYSKKNWNDLSQDEIDSINPYLLNRYLSMNLEYLDIVNYVQKTIPTHDKEKYYKIYKNLIPKKKQWLKYIKSKSKKDNKELLEYLSKYFECSQREVQDYINIIDDSKIKEILSYFGLDDKEITKLIKSC